MLPDDSLWIDSFLFESIEWIFKHYIEHSFNLVLIFSFTICLLYSFFLSFNVTSPIAILITNDEWMSNWHCCFISYSFIFFFENGSGLKRFGFNWPVARWKPPLNTIMRQRTLKALVNSNSEREWQWERERVKCNRMKKNRQTNEHVVTATHHCMTIATIPFFSMNTCDNVSNAGCVCVWMCVGCRLRDVDIDVDKSFIKLFSSRDFCTNVSSLFSSVHFNIRIARNDVGCGSGGCWCWHRRRWTTHFQLLRRH